MNNTLFNLSIIKNNSDYEDVAFKSDLLNLNYKFASAFYIHHPDRKSFTAQYRGCKLYLKPKFKLSEDGECRMLSNENNNG